MLSDLVNIPFLFLCFSDVFAVLKRTRKSKNDLINAEEGEDHFTDISSVGEDSALDL